MFLSLDGKVACIVVDFSAVYTKQSLLPASFKLIWICGRQFAKMAMKSSKGEIETQPLNAKDPKLLKAQASNLLLVFSRKNGTSFKSSQVPVPTTLVTYFQASTACGFKSSTKSLCIQHCLRSFLSHVDALLGLLDLSHSREADFTTLLAAE